MVSLGSSGLLDGRDQISDLRDNLDQFKRDVEASTEQTLDEGADDLRERIEDNAPRSPEGAYRDDEYRRLSDSVEVHQAGPLEYHVVVDHEASRHVEYGTSPHYIRARGTPNEYLHFKIGNRWVKVREVRHPGTDPQPYVRPAVEELRPIIRDRIIEDIRNAKQRAFGD